MASRSAKSEMESLPESDRAGDLPHPRMQQSLFGHGQSAATLASAARSGQMHHAWLLTGPKGIGKATLAWRFAKALLKHGAQDCPDDLHTDPDHPISKQVASLTHPDILLLRRPWDSEKKRFKVDLPVNEVRLVNSFFGKHASFGGMRIAIVDCMDDMNSNAQNALLKNLEEPPKSTIFLLISHSAGLLLPTTRSRCRTLTLRKLNSTEMSGAVEQLCAGISSEERELAVALADGVPGFAAGLATSGAALLYKDYLNITGQLPALNQSMVFGFAERVAKLPPDQGVFQFVALQRLIFHRLVQSSLISQNVLAIEQKPFATMLRAIPPQGWTELWSEISDNFARVDALNLDKKQFVINNFYSLEAKAALYARS